MAQTSSIEWTETTWNPVVGCNKKSPGCANCYAERMAFRLASIGKARAKDGANPGRIALYQGVINNRGKWSGNLITSEEALNDPYKWKSPRMIFVNSMSDLFHEKVDLSFIKRVFGVMNDCSQHTFQILTKRPERAAEIAPGLFWSDNIWMGTSIENSAEMGRIQWLKQINSRIRFLSLEPLLAPLQDLPLESIHWVIVGGESGPGARPIHQDWVTNIRDQCVLAGVPFFFKQWGGKNKKATGRLLDGRCWNQYPSYEKERSK